MFRRTDKLKGFTLIELLVVIAIIAILAVVIILNLTQARKKARDAQRKDDMRNIVLALENYYDDHNQYVSTADAWVQEGSNNTNTNVFLKKGPLKDFLKSDVKDPNNNSSYYYKYQGTANTFRVCAQNMEISSNANLNNSYCVSNK